MTLASLPLPAGADVFYAPPAPAEDAPVFSGEAELGFTELSGNSDSRTLIARGRLTWLTGRLTHTLRGEVLRIETNDETSTEQYLVGGRERYELQGPHYLFGFARWEKDRFSGYEYLFTTIAGYGRQVLDGPTHVLSLETGPGYRHEEGHDGTSQDLGIGYGALDYRWNVSQGAYFEQEMSVEGSSSNVTARALSTISAKLNSSLALKFSHELRHNTNPPEDDKAHTDRITAMSILYSW
ncbi:YdiY family protein [Halomonas shantousis]